MLFKQLIKRINFQRQANTLSLDDIKNLRESVESPNRIETGSFQPKSEFLKFGGLFLIKSPFEEVFNSPYNCFVQFWAAVAKGPADMIEEAAPMGFVT